MEQKHNLNVCACVCLCMNVNIGTCQCPLSNNKHMEIPLINKHVANKKIIMNLHVQLRSLKIEHLN